MDRTSLINSLKNAMETKSEPEDERLVFDSVSIERHNYARLVDIKDVKTEEQLYIKYPESYSVKELYNSLMDCNETSMKNAAVDVKTKFFEAAQNEDDKRVSEIVNTASDLNGKLMSASSDPGRKNLVYMIIADTIKKL